MMWEIPINLGEPSFRIGLNTQSKNFKIIENQINKKAEIAMKYFKISYEINTKYCINKIKCIITLLYIAKCQLCVEKTKTEAIDTMRNAINYFIYIFSVTNYHFLYSSLL